MEDRMVVVIVALVISFIASMIKKAQSIQNAAKKKEGADKGFQGELKLRADSKKTSPSAVPSDPIPTLPHQESDQSTIRPFGGAAAESSGEWTQPMSSSFGDAAPKQNHTMRGVSVKAADTGVRAPAEDEISPIAISLQRDSLLQGVILAEVLKRPKPGAFSRLPADR